MHCLRYIFCFCWLSLLGGGISYGQIVLRLPTQNTAIFTNKPSDFFMYVNRNFEGQKSTPWEGGTYGFSRTPVRTQSGVINIKFHEGIDIKPMERATDGSPVDQIHPVSGGIVVHTSTHPGDSSYGRYVVIEHPTTDGPIYSLYAHLASISCKPGDKVGTGNVIGVMGFSGIGINKERSHVHLEIGMLLNKNFQQWYDAKKISSPNKHGLFNGFNICGINPVDALTLCKEGTPFSLKSYLATLKPEYIIRIPSTGIPDIAKRYPFLLKTGSSPQVSCDIAFADSGIPLSVTPSAIPCSKPTVIKATTHPFSQLYRTVNRINGSSKAPKLTGSGTSYINLLMIGTEP